MAKRRQRISLTVELMLAEGQQYRPSEVLAAAELMLGGTTVLVQPDNYSLPGTYRLNVVGFAGTTKPAPQAPRTTSVPYQRPKPLPPEAVPSALLENSMGS